VSLVRGRVAGRRLGHDVDSLPPFRREARLRPEHAWRYPDITVGVWEPAAVLCDRVLAGGLLRGSMAWCDRVLPPEHFEFRGGAPEGERPRREDR
jgi:hypothetical protein